MACGSVQEIINTLATAEALAVALLGGALENAENGKLALNAEQKQALRAARAQEQAHYAFLTGAGAKASMASFTLPDPGIVTDAGTLFKKLIELEELFVAAYLAAAQEFAMLKEVKWVQHSLAIGAVEAEHRVAVRVLAIEAGTLEGLPNDVAFEKAIFANVGAAGAALKEMGFIDRGSLRLTYPGPGAIDNTGVTHLQP